MLRTGLSVLVLLLMSGCATFIGDEPGTMDETSANQLQNEQSGGEPGSVDETSAKQTQNEQLRTEAAALRQAVSQRQEELDRLKAESPESGY